MVIEIRTVVTWVKGGVEMGKEQERLFWVLEKVYSFIWLVISWVKIH